MTTCKLIFRNVRRNIRDYLVYYLTLTLAVGMFYAFNSIASQSAFADMSATAPCCTSSWVRCCRPCRWSLRWCWPFWWCTPTSSS